MLYSETNVLREFRKKYHYKSKNWLDNISTTFAIRTQKNYDAMPVPREEAKKMMISPFFVSGAMNYTMAPEKGNG